MTRTSPDAEPVASPRNRRPLRRFAFAAIAVVSCLTVAAATLAVSALERGPRIRSVDGDADLAVQQSGVTLMFRADQPLDESSANDVNVEPDVAFEVDVSGSALRVRLTDTLDHARTYRVSIPSLRGRATDATAAAEYDFTTPPLTITTLERGGDFFRASGDDDRIVRHDLSSGSASTLISAPRIQEYADDGDGVVAAIIDENGRSSLVRAAGADEATGAAGADEATEVTPLPLPGDGTIGLLRASSDAARAGFVFSGTGTDGVQYLSTLFILDPADPDAGARPVVGVDGAPVQADSWFFIPGSAYLVAQAPSGALILLDATGTAPPRLLGEVGTLRGVLPASTSLVIDGAEGPTVLDLTNGSLTDIRDASAEDVATGTSFLSPSESVRWTATDVTRRTAAAPADEVFRADAARRIEEVCVSPSGRFAAVGVVAGTSPTDNYPTRADRLGRTSVVLDLSSGDEIATVAGTRPDWCP